MTFLISSIALFAPSLAVAFHVVLDPGHGGKDHGAVHEHLRESDITLEVTKVLQAKLERHPGIRVTLTRSDDSSVPLDERALKVQELRGDVFVSIHANSNPSARAKGVELYFENQLAPDQEALFLASRENQSTESTESNDWPLGAAEGAKRVGPEVTLILKDLQRNQRIKSSATLARTLLESWRGNRRAKEHSIRQAPFRMVNAAPMPSVLVELGFLSNPEEAKALAQRTYQERLADSLYEGLVKYKEVIDKAP